MTQYFGHTETQLPPQVGLRAAPLLGMWVACGHQRPPLIQIHPLRHTLFPWVPCLLSWTRSWGTHPLGWRAVYRWLERGQTGHWLLSELCLVEYRNEVWCHQDQQRRVGDGPPPETGSSRTCPNPRHSATGYGHQVHSEVHHTVRKKHKIKFHRWRHRTISVYNTPCFVIMSGLQSQPMKVVWC